MPKAYMKRPAGTYNTYSQAKRQKTPYRKTAKKGKGVLSTSVFQASPSTPERKWLDVAGTYFVGGVPTGTVNFINGIPQGIGNNQRIGARTVLTSIAVKGGFSVAVNLSYNPIVRIKVVYDKQTNLVQPLATDILSADNPTGFNNLLENDRFITIFDEVLEPLPASATGGYLFYQYNLFKKVNLPMTLAGVGATVASVETGGVFVLTYCNTAAAAVVGQVASSRIRYTDA